MNCETGIDVCALPCVKQIPSGNLWYSVGNLARYSMIHRWMERVERWDRRLKREGIYVYISTVHSVVQQKLTQHYKAIIPQLKKKEDFSSSPKKESHLFLFVPLFFNNLSIRRKRPQKTFSLETQGKDGLQHLLPLYCLFS